MYSRRVEEWGKVVVMAVLVSACCALAYYFHAVVHNGVVFLHLFYVPIVLAVFWWGRWGVGVALLLGAWLVTTQVLNLPEVSLWVCGIRVFMFLTVGIITAVLSERMKGQTEALSKSTAEWQETFDSISDPISFHDLEFKITRMNRAFIEAFGAKPEELVGKRCYELIHGTDSPPEFCPHAKTMETRERASAEFFEPHLGIWAEVVSSPVFDSKGEVVSIVHITRDITDRVRAVKALKESEERFRAIFDNVNDGIALADIETGKFNSCNRKMCEMLGYSREEIETLGIADIHPEKDLSYVMEQFEKQACGEMDVARDIPVKKRNGAVFYADINSNPITLGGKKYVVGIFRDMTESVRLRERERVAIEAQAKAVAERIRADELKQAYEELKKTESMLVQSEKLLALGELGAGVAHELNSPLAGVLSLIRSHRRDSEATGEEERDLRDMEEACVQMSEIIKDLTDFSRASSGKRVKIDLNDVIDRTLGFLSGLMEKRGVKIVKDYDEDLPAVLADRSQLQQVVVNMITNARDAMEGRGEFRIKTGVKKTRKGRFVEMEFADTGCGVKKEDLPKIFDPFFTTKRPGGGVGLGLSVCHTIIKGHGGTMGVKSEEGRGTTFTIRIPVAKSD